MHSACIKNRTSVSVLFVCRCYFFDLKISIKSNINCSIKLRLWCFKSTPSMYALWLFYYFDGRFLSDRTYRRTHLCLLFYVSRGIYNIVNKSLWWPWGKATWESCGINSDLCVNFASLYFKLIMSVITPGEHIAFHNYSKYAHVLVWAIMKYVSSGPIK